MGMMPSQASQETWSCGPSWPPRTLYAIFAMAHSASTTACGVVNTIPDASCADERLNPNRTTAEWHRQLLSDPESALRQKYEEAMRKAGAHVHAPCAWGFKVYPVRPPEPNANGSSSPS